MGHIKVSAFPDWNWLTTLPRDGSIVPHHLFLLPQQGDKHHFSLLAPEDEMGGKNLFLKTSTLQYHSRALYKIQVSASIGISNTRKGTSLSNYRCLWTRLWATGRKAEFEHLANLRQRANWCPIAVAGANEKTGAQRLLRKWGACIFSWVRDVQSPLLLYFRSGWPQSHYPDSTSVFPVFVLSSLL